MTSIGDALRRERLRRNLDLESVSRELKITSRLLEAIEAEQFDKIPGGVFAKSFVRQYAHFLGLDEEEMAAEVERMLREEAEPFPKDESPAPASPRIPLPRMERWQSLGSKSRWSTFLPSAVLVVVVMLLCSAVYAFWQRTHRPATVAVAQNLPVPAQKPAVPPSTAPAAQQAKPLPSQQPVTQPLATQPLATQSSPTQPPTTPAAAPDTSETSSPVPAPPADAATASPSGDSAPAPAAPGEAQPPKPAGQVHVELTAREPVWVLVRVDGKYLFSGTLEASQTRTVDAQGTVLLRIGNAAGINVALNGKPLGQLGPEGQVRTLQLTSGGFQIVAEPKSPLPLDPL